MGVLRISLFGGVRIEHGGGSSTERPTRAVQGLLAYLLLHRHRSHSRDALLGLFWADQCEHSARACLNTTLWRLRRVLEPDGVARGTYLINARSGDLAFNRESDHWFDVGILEERANRVLRAPAAAVGEADADALEAALELYTGDLLEGVYSDWALRERERLRSLYLDSLTWLMRYHRDQGAYGRSLTFGEKILARDALREEIHREMMRLRLRNGQRAMAVRQYESCRDLLAAELDVEPMEETQALYAQIVDGRRARAPSREVDARFAAIEPVLRRLREALRTVEHAREQCHHALELAERLEPRPRKLADR